MQGRRRRDARIRSHRVICRRHVRFSLTVSIRDEQELKLKLPNSKDRCRKSRYRKLRESEIGIPPIRFYEEFSANHCLRLTHSCFQYKLPYALLYRESLELTKKEYNFNFFEPNSPLVSVFLNQYLGRVLRVHYP